jgi:hypothetical protein
MFGIQELTAGFAKQEHCRDRVGELATVLLADTRGHEAVPAFHARASTNARLGTRVAMHLLVATSGEAHTEPHAVVRRRAG